MYPVNDDIENLSRRWVHKEKKRYYRITLSQDLLGDWIITKSWGSLITSAGRAVHIACASKEEAAMLAKKIENVRKNREYVFG